MPVLTVWARQINRHAAAACAFRQTSARHQETRTPPEPSGCVRTQWFVVPGGLFWLAV